MHESEPEAQERVLDREADDPRSIGVGDRDRVDSAYEAHLRQLVQELSGGGVAAADASGDLVTPGAPRGDRAQDGEVDAVLAQIGVLAEEEAGLLSKQAIGGEDLALDVRSQGRGWIERLQVVGDATERRRRCGSGPRASSRGGSASPH